MQTNRSKNNNNKSRKNIATSTLVTLKERRKKHHNLIRQGCKAFLSDLRNHLEKQQTTAPAPQQEHPLMLVIAACHKDNKHTTVKIHQRTHQREIRYSRVKILVNTALLLQQNKQTKTARHKQSRSVLPQAKNQPEHRMSVFANFYERNSRKYFYRCLQEITKRWYMHLAISVGGADILRA